MEQELEQVTAIYNQITSFLVNYSFQLLGAIIIFLIGMLVAHRISTIVLRLCQRKKLDVTLSGFIANTTKLIIIVMTAIIALGKLGISITPFVAAVGAISLGAGLAVQGLLSNYGAGLNIILARPFVVGDTISVQGVCGVLKVVHLAYTLLSNEDDVSITVPNKQAHRGRDHSQLPARHHHRDPRWYRLSERPQGGNRRHTGRIEQD
jgi:small conductance mechanosensitive channel